MRLYNAHNFMQILSSLQSNEQHVLLVNDLSRMSVQESDARSRVDEAAVASGEFRVDAKRKIPQLTQACRHFHSNESFLPLAVAKP